MMPCGKNIHSSHLISLSKPFLSFIALLLIHYAFLITVAGSEFFFLYGFLSVAWSSQLALITDGFVFSHPSFLVSLHFDCKQWEARFLSGILLYPTHGPEADKEWGKERLQSQDTTFLVTALLGTGFVSFGAKLLTLFIPGGVFIYKVKGSTR